MRADTAMLIRSMQTLSREARTVFAVATAAIAEAADRMEAMDGEIEKLRHRLRLADAAIRSLADQDATLSVCDGNVTVTTDATLTDAERDAISTAMNAYGENNDDAECAQIEQTLWRLLERTK